MIEVGIVRRIEGQVVWVAGPDPQGCASCGSRESCGSCEAPGKGNAEGHVALDLFGIRSKERLLALRNASGLQLRSGDRVEYSVSAAKAIKAGFFVLILPILSFLLLYGLVAVLRPGTGEGLKVLAGLSGLVLAFLLNLLLSRRRLDYPEIQRVLHEERQGS